jgi:hypothetical protein
MGLQTPLFFLISGDSTRALFLHINSCLINQIESNGSIDWTLNWFCYGSITLVVGLSMMEFSTLWKLHACCVSLLERDGEATEANYACQFNLIPNLRPRISLSGIWTIDQRLQFLVNQIAQLAIKLIYLWVMWSHLYRYITTISCSNSNHGRTSE